MSAYLNPSIQKDSTRKTPPKDARRSVQNLRRKQARRRVLRQVRHYVRQPKRRIVRLGILLLLAFAAFVWWPVDSYGEGVLWNVKTDVDRLIRDRAVVVVVDLQERWDEAAMRRRDDSARKIQEFLRDVETHVVQLTNEERTARNRQQLRYDSTISKIARKHSENMLLQEKLEHRLDGKDPSDRARAAEYNCRRDLGGGRYSFGLAENIHYQEPYSRNTAKLAASIVAGWMSSPGHRENILASEYARIGVGIAIDGQKLYATQNFSSCL